MTNRQTKSSHMLMILNKINDNPPLFLVAAAKMGIDLNIVLYDQVSCIFKDGRNQILIGNANLDEYDLVYFRTIGTYSELVENMAEYCIQRGIVVIDPTYTSGRPWINRKSFEYMRLSGLGLPIIDTFLVNSKNFATYENKISYPCVVKRTDGYQGNAVWLCNQSEEVKKLLDEQNCHLIVQKYIKNDGDYRLFVIGDKVIAAMKRQSQTDDFRNNVSLGGIGTVYQPKLEQARLAIRAAQAMGYAIAGVDLIFQAKTNQLYIMEVNLAPQFQGLMKATGIDIPQQILKYFLSLINK